MKRFGRKGEVALAIVVGFALAGVFLPLACRLPNFLIIDDGYFYAEIAYRLATEGRSTFDGIHTTSGYHLPWAFVLAGVSKVIAPFTRDHVIHLYAYIAVALSIAVATARHFYRSWLFQLCGLVLIVSNFSLTEMVLAAPIVLGILRGGRRVEWLAATLPLVRIDLVCVPLVVALMTLRENRGLALRLGAASIAGAALQLLIMKLAFGHFASVSAILKATTNLTAIGARIRINLTSSPFDALFYVAHVLFCVFALALRPDRSTIRLVVASFVFLLPHVLTNFIRGWYWVPSSIAILYALEHALEGNNSVVAKHRRMAQTAVAFLTFSLLVHATRVEVFYAPDARGSLQFLSELRRIVPPNTAIYTLDQPGFLGFFSGLRVVDGDGLVNDYAYAERLHQDGSLATYLDEEDICYVVIDHVDTLPVRAGPIVFGPADVESLAVIREHHWRQSDFELLRLTAPRCQGR